MTQKFTLNQGETLPSASQKEDRDPLNNSIPISNALEAKEFPGGLLKNTVFLGKTLDITKVDPAAISSSLTSINALNFDVSEDTAIPSSDGRFGIPQGTKFNPIFSTDVSLSTSVFEEKTDIYEEFSFSVSIGEDNSNTLTESNSLKENDDPEKEDEGDDKKSAYSGSFTCKFINQTISENKSIVAYSSAVHKLYILRKNIAYDPKKIRVDDEFEFWITKKLNVNDLSTFTKFVQEVGTHYITSVLYGGLGYQVLNIDSESLKTLKEQHISISAAAQEIMLKSSASYDQKTTYSSFKESVTAKTVFIGGTLLPHISPETKTLDFTEWSESVINEPLPLSIKVERISLLLTSDYFPSIEAPLLAQLQKNLDLAIDTYLKAHPRATPKTFRPITVNDGQLQKVGFVQNRSPYNAISQFYTQWWSSAVYAFPKLMELSPSKFIISSTSQHEKTLNDGSVINISYLDKPSIPSECVGDILAWYGTCPQAYFEAGYQVCLQGTASENENLKTRSSGETSWVIEKVNKGIDPIIREEDIIRIRKNGCQSYICSSSPMQDGYSTLTWTTNIKDAEFIIKIL